MDDFIDSLLGLGALDEPSPRRRKTPMRRQAPRRRVVESPITALAADEARDAHLKAAVFPSEKPLLEHMVRVVHQCTMSDFLRDFLLREYATAKQAGKV
jgi:hypothetical protein